MSKVRLYQTARQVQRARIEQFEKVGKASSVVVKKAKKRRGNPCIKVQNFIPCTKRGSAPLECLKKRRKQDILETMRQKAGILL